ncbi:hypothetical protein ACWGQ5_21485 [Streptomyces sp. NPDC055722]
MVSDPLQHARRRGRPGIGRAEGYRGEARGRPAGQPGRPGVDGAGVLLAFVLFVAVVVLVVHDGEFRGALWTFVRSL